MTFVEKFDADMADKLTFFEKSDVNGANTREPYAFLKKEAPNEDASLDIRWNFGKLFSLCGSNRGWFLSMTRIVPLTSSILIVQ